MSRGRTALAAGATAAGVIALDQLTKALVRDNHVFGERRDQLLLLGRLGGGVQV